MKRMNCVCYCKINKLNESNFAFGLMLKCRDCYVREVMRYVKVFIGKEIRNFKRRNVENSYII